MAGHQTAAMGVRAAFSTVGHPRQLRAAGLNQLGLRAQVGCDVRSRPRMRRVSSIPDPPETTDQTAHCATVTTLIGADATPAIFGRQSTDDVGSSISRVGSRSFRCISSRVDEAAAAADRSVAETRRLSRSRPVGRSLTSASDADAPEAFAIYRHILFDGTHDYFLADRTCQPGQRAGHSTDRSSSWTSQAFVGGALAHLKAGPRGVPFLTRSTPLKSSSTSSKRCPGGSPDHCVPFAAGFLPTGSR